jgi:CheY-like chemotaxis protein
MERKLILIAEDQENEILLMWRAFQKANVTNPLCFVRDGKEAIAYFKGEGTFANRAEYPLPDLLLLDLKMPCMDGFQVLEWVRQQPELQELRIVVLTNSCDMRDVKEAFRLGANSFLVKPVNVAEFIELVVAIRDYCLGPLFELEEMHATADWNGDHALWFQRR